MGISLKDFGNFAVGAIEQDRETLKKDLLLEMKNYKLIESFFN